MNLQESLRAINRELHEDLIAIRRFSEKTWEKPLLPWFTKHDVSHSDEVIFILGELVSPLYDTPQWLSDNELFVLLASAYLHDIGMQYLKVDGKSITELRPEDYDAIRKAHAEKTFQLICNNFRDSNHRDDVKIPDIEEDFLSVIALVSKAHSADFFHEVADCFDGEVYRPRNRPFRGSLLASLLLLADELDLHSKRVNFKETGLYSLPLISQVHWFKHHYIDKVKVINGTILIGIRTHNDDPRYVSAVKELVGMKLNQQIATVSRYLSATTNGVLSVSKEIVFEQLDDKTGSKRLMPEATFQEMLKLLGRDNASNAFPDTATEPDPLPIATTREALPVPRQERYNDFAKETASRTSYKLSQLDLVGNSKANGELTKLLQTFGATGIASGPILVVGEEGTGKSMLIGTCIDRLLHEPIILKFSGKSFSNKVDRFFFSVLGSIFGEHPYYDGKILSKLNSFCERNQLVSARNLYNYLATICAGQIDKSQADAKSFPALTARTGQIVTKGDITVSDEKYSRSQFCPYTELWNVLKVFSAEVDKRVVLWLEDAQLFPTDDVNVMLSLFQNSTESEANLLLIGEFRAERTRDLAKYKETYGKYVRHKPLQCSDLSKDEIRDLIADAMAVSKSKVRKDLSSYLHKASGGNPKFIVDYLKFLVEQGAVRKEKDGSSEEELLFIPPVQLSIPSELKAICKERIKLYRPTFAELCVLSLLAVADSSDLPVPLLTAVVDGAEDAIKRLMDDLGIIKDSESTDIWSIRFDHLTAKDSCFELLTEQPIEFMELLLIDLRSKISGGIEDDGALLELLPICKNLAFLAEDPTAIAETVLPDILGATSKDLPYLKSCAKILLHQVDKSEYNDLVRHFILAKIGEIEGSPDCGKLYRKIFGFERFITDWDNIKHKGLLTALLHAYAQNITEDVSVASVIWDKVCQTVSKLVSSAPLDYLKLASRQYVFGTFCDRLSSCFSNVEVLGVLGSSASTKGLDVESQLILTYYMSQMVKEPVNLTLFDSELVSSKVRKIISELKESSGRDDEVRYFARIGSKILVWKFNRLCKAEVSSEMEVTSAYNDAVSYIDEINEILQGFHSHSSLKLSLSFTRRYAKFLARTGNFSGSIKILAALPCCDFATQILIQAELATISYINAGSVGEYGSQLTESLSLLSNYKVLPPDSVAAVVNAMLAIGPLGADKVAPLIDKWLLDLSTGDYDLAEIVNLLIDLISFHIIDSTHCFGIIKSRYKLSHSDRILINICEIKACAMSCPSKGKQAFLVSKLKVLKEMYDHEIDFASMGDYNFPEIFSDTVTDMALLLQDTPESFYWWKYSKRLLESLQGDKSDLSFLRRRWYLMLALDEADLARKECEEFLLEGDKKFGHELLTILYAPTCVGRKRQNDLVTGLINAKLLNDLDPASVTSITFIEKILEALDCKVDPDYEARVETCKYRLIEMSNNYALYKLLSSHFLYLYRRERTDEALSVASEAHHFARKIIPPRLDRIMECKNNVEFVRLSLSLAHPEVASDVLENLRTLLEDSFFHSTSSTARSLALLPTFNYAIALLLHKKEIDASQQLLEQMLKQKSDLHLSDRTSYLILCRFDGTSYYGVCCRDLELGFAINVALHNLYKSQGNSSKQHEAMSAIRILKERFKISDRTFVSIVDC